MLRFAIQYKELNEILKMLTQVLGIRILFFDGNLRPYAEFDVKPDSGYCARLRRDPAFNAKCLACDRLHLERTRLTKKQEIYVCHNGLIEGVVPLFDDNRCYLGALAFGQIRPPGGRLGKKMKDRYKNLYNQLPCYDFPAVKTMGQLFEYLAYYIRSNHLVRMQGASWAEKVKEHVKNHLSSALTIRELALAAGVSPSFLSHSFRTEFGLPVRKYVIPQKMREARRLLKKGATVKKAALELGFCDEFHFSRMFKYTAGQVPSRFKGL
jgi:AraC-like DNA-binding protein